MRKCIVSMRERPADNDLIPELRNERQTTVRLTNTRLAAYSAPALPIAAFATPLAIYAPPFYATDMGLGLTAVGTIFMVARFWDLFTDPVMGCCRTSSRPGGAAGATGWSSPSPFSCSPPCW